MSARGTTKAELDATMTKLLEHVRKRVVPGYEPMYRCAGGCQDTGWVEIDNGLDANGKRERAPVVRKCTRCSGPTPRSEPARGGSFS